MSYVIITDSSAELPWDYVDALGVHCIEMTVVMGNDTLIDGRSMDYPDYYRRLGAGEVATTSQVATGKYLDVFENYLQQGKDILVLGLSLALSESYTNACAAAKELEPRYPERKIYVCETTCVSLGLGLFVHEACKRRDAGMDFDALCAWAEEHKTVVQHRFIVEDLMFLHRGGRVSRGSAVVGSLIGIRPLLHVSKKGKLISHGKCRGRKQTLLKMAEDYARLHASEEPLDVFISHGDCEEEARFLMEEVKKIHPVGKEIIRHLSSTVGAHVGPGCMALFFMGKDNREDD